MSTPGPKALDDAERARLWAEILDDVGAIFREHHAAEDWGRVLVEVVRAPDGEPQVAGIEVEDIVGDERRVDQAFAPERAGALLPVLAKATEALCGLQDVELERVRGGTFLRQPQGGFAWLPGLVHVPSAALERVWEEVEGKLRALQADLETRFRLGTFERYDLDIEAGRIVFSSRGQERVAGRATLVGSYSRGSRTWAWGGSNSNLPARVRAASAALVDGIPERDMWELSTPIFPLDEGTAWVLAGLACVHAGADGIYRAEDGESRVFVMLRELAEVA